MKNGGFISRNRAHIHKYWPYMAEKWQLVLHRIKRVERDTQQMTNHMFSLSVITLLFFGDWYFYSQWCCWDQSKTWHSTHQKLYFFTPFLQSGIPNILHHKPSLHMDCARALWDMLELHRAISQITCWSFILKMGLNPSTSTRPRKIHFHIWNSGGKSLKWACRWVCVRERDENELVKKFG